MLELSEVHAFYGLSHILFGISLTVREGESVGLLGRNGAGKTTTLRAIMGLTSVQQGEIRLNGENINRFPPYKRSWLGLGLVPEDRRIFPELTVRENLAVPRPRRGSESQFTIQQICDLFPQLGALMDRRGDALSGGEQQMLTVARTLMSSPSLLLLDEPSEGLAPAIVEVLLDQLRLLKSRGITILMAEQNVAFTSALSDRVYIIEKGEIKFGGDPNELLADSEVRRRYLAV